MSKPNLTRLYGSRSLNVRSIYDAVGKDIDTTRTLVVFREDEDGGLTLSRSTDSMDEAIGFVVRGIIGVIGQPEDGVGWADEDDDA
jgi:hypothetical protein